jgi:hypothetical protein
MDNKNAIRQLLHGQENAIHILLGDYEGLDMADKGVAYAVVSQFEKIMADTKKIMNGIVREALGTEREFETPDVKIIFDCPDPESVVDVEKLQEEFGTAALMDLGILKSEVIVHLNEKALEQAILNGQIEPEKVKASMVETTRAPRLIVNPKGDLKKRLAAMKKACLPSGE